MKIGCVKEIKNNEFRVGLTPDNVKAEFKVVSVVKEIQDEIIAPEKLFVKTVKEYRI